MLAASPEASWIFEVDGLNHAAAPVVGRNKLVASSSVATPDFTSMILLLGESATSTRVADRYRGVPNEVDVARPGLVPVGGIASSRSVIEVIVPATEAIRVGVCPVMLLLSTTLNVAGASSAFD